MGLTQQQHSEHKHDIVYYGVVNLIRDNTVLGAIDVWKCRGCPEIFCEDKRYGIMDLASEVGFPKIESGAKWAALICAREKTSDWTLLGAKPGSMIHHSCTPDTKVELTVGPDYNVLTGIASGIGIHKIILLERFVNSAVDVITGQPHTGPTNANPAPGRPFSFTPERSAAVDKESWHNFYNVNASTLFLAGVWAAYLGIILLPNGSAAVILSGLLGIIAGYLTLNKRGLGPIIGILAGLTGLGGLLMLGFLGGDLKASMLAGVLILNIGLSSIARTRIQRLSKLQWHPLDMPAYG